MSVGSRLRLTIPALILWPLLLAQEQSRPQAKEQSRPQQTAPAALPSGSGLSVDRVTYDGALRKITVVLRNTSDREITGFGWSVKLDSDGAAPLVHQETVDILPLLILRGVGQLADPAKKQSFQPGETYAVEWVPPTQWGALEQSRMTAEASTMVIYSDCTAVGDSASIEQVFAWRRTQVAADVDVLARVKAVKRDGGSRERLQKVREEIETLAKSGAGSNFREESRILDQILAYYELLGWDGVDTLLNRQDVRARRMSQQSYRKE